MSGENPDGDGTDAAAAESTDSRSTAGQATGGQAPDDGSTDGQATSDGSTGGQATSDGSTGGQAPDDGSTDGAPSGMPGPAPEERPHPDCRRDARGVRVDPEAGGPERRSAVVSALVEHEPGVLSSVSGLFSRRQFNIESLTVGPTTVDGHARVTLVVEESDHGIDQVKKQLAKLPPVIQVGELDDDAVRAELVVLKVRGDRPDEVHAVTRMYEGQTLDAGPRTITVQITGDQQRIDDAIDAFRQFGIVEIARTGPTALARGDTPTTPGETPGHVLSGGDPEHAPSGAGRADGGASSEECETNGETADDGRADGEAADDRRQRTAETTR